MRARSGAARSRLPRVSAYMRNARYNGLQGIRHPASGRRSVSDRVSVQRGPPAQRRCAYPDGRRLLQDCSAILTLTDRGIQSTPRAREGIVTVDLNSDLGESFGRWVLGDDEAMLGLVTSANVACGFHAGDPSTLRRTCAIGRAAAWSSGRRSATGTWPGSAAGSSTWSPRRSPTTSSTRSARWTGCAGWRAPPSATSSRTARSTTRSCTTRRRPTRSSRRCGTTTRRCPCSGCPGRSCWARPRPPDCARCRSSSSTAATPPRPRSSPAPEPGALLHDPDDVAARVLRMVTDGVVTAVDGSDVRVTAESACVHGDSPGAVAMATRRARRARPRRGRAARRSGRGLNVLPCGDAGLLIEVDELSEVLALAAALRARPPARRARHRPRRPHGAAHARHPAPTSPRAPGGARRCPSTPGAARRGGDGARSRSSTTGPISTRSASSPASAADGVVEAHTGTPWRVAFGGFAPGFAYLAGGDARLDVRAPCRAADVGAGRVGRAGRRVQRRLPALVARWLAADRPHRCPSCGTSSAVPCCGPAVASGSGGAVNAARTVERDRVGHPEREREGAAGRAVEVLAPVPWPSSRTSAGRGYAASGVGRSGATDRAALRLANRLVANPEGAAGIEVIFGGPRRPGPQGAHRRDGRCARAADVDGTPVGHHAVVPVRPGRCSGSAHRRTGLRTYVAVRGGIASPVLGSRSTDVLAGLGPPRSPWRRAAGRSGARRVPARRRRPGGRAARRPGAAAGGPGPRADRDRRPSALTRTSGRRRTAATGSACGSTATGCDRAGTR